MRTGGILFTITAGGGGILWATLPANEVDGRDGRPDEAVASPRFSLISCAEVGDADLGSWTLLAMPALETSGGGLLRSRGGLPLDPRSRRRTSR
jgi:hypothetical protein